MPIEAPMWILAGIRNSSIVAASTMQTVTMKISPSISSTTHYRSLLDMIIMDLSLTVCVFHLACRAANLARRDAEDPCAQVLCRGLLNSMPISLNSSLEPSARDVIELMISSPRSNPLKSLLITVMSRHSTGRGRSRVVKRRINLFKN